MASAQGHAGPPRARLPWRAGLGALLGALLLLAGTSQAQAHAGEGGAILLLPTHLYILGGALAVLASFGVLTLLHRGADEPAEAESRERRLPPRLVQGLSLASLVLLALLIAAGLFGKPDPLSNPLPMTIWTLWWGGFTLVTVCLGDLWSITNPWIGLYRLIGQRPRFAYPERLGTWPAILLFLGFAWFELVYPAPEDPERLALAVAAYWLVNFGALLTFGPRWLDRGEAFSVFFAMVGSFSPLRWRRNEGEEACSVRLALRRPGHGLGQVDFADVSGAAFILLTLSAVSFDGLSRTFSWAGWLGLNPLEYPGRSAVIGPNGKGLVVSWLVLAALYAGAIAMGPVRAGLVSWRRALPLFALSIVPISIAYHLAHYLPTLIVETPAAILALTDPFGLGWEALRPTWLHSGSTMGLGADGIVAIYRIQTAIVVAGHMLAAVSAHCVALSLALSRRTAVASQIPLTVLMVGYTLFGLWLLSTPEIG